MKCAPQSHSLSSPCLSVCLPACLSLRFGRLVIKEGAEGGVFLRCVAEALQKALRFR